MPVCTSAVSQELEENVEYVEKEDEFDVVDSSTDTKERKRKAGEGHDEEDEIVSIEAIDTVGMLSRVQSAAVFSVCLSLRRGVIPIGRRYRAGFSFVLEVAVGCYACGAHPFGTVAVLCREGITWR